MERITKYLIIVIVSLTILFSLLILSLKLGVPNHQLTDGFLVTLTGKIFPSEELISTDYRPSAIYAYASEFKQICGVEQLQISELHWNKNKSEGKYDMTFWLPIERSVVITTNCGDCNYSEIYLTPSDNIKHNLSLIWDNVNCFENKIMEYEDAEDAINRARSLLSSVSKDFERKKEFYNISDTEAIRTDLENGWDEIQEKGYTKDLNLSLIHSYRAMFYAWRADSRMELYDMGVCLEKIEAELNVTNESTCYIPPYEGYSEYKAVKADYLYNVFSFNDVSYLKDVNLVSTNLDQIKFKINNILEKRRDLRQTSRQCEESYKLVSASLSHQKPYCERRNVSIFLIKSYWILVALSLGILVGRWILKGDK